eukprot:313326-Amphidinium_carterae.1
MLLEAWRKFAHDPDYEVAGWFHEGAPGGITKWPKQLGVFPPESTEPEIDHQLLATDFDHFVNYASVDNDPDAFEELHKHAQLGYLAKCDTLADTENFLRAKPILS